MGWWCGQCAGQLPFGEPTVHWPKGGEECLNCGKVHVPTDAAFKDWAFGVELPDVVNTEGVVLGDGRKYKQFGNLMGLLEAVCGWSAMRQRELARANNRIKELEQRLGDG